MCTGVCSAGSLPACNSHQSRCPQRKRFLLQVEKHSGTIINIGSTAALRPVAAFPVYSAAKFGLRGWSLNCHEALRKHGVKVTLLNPGVCASASLPALPMQQTTGVPRTHAHR